MYWIETNSGEYFERANKSHHNDMTKIGCCQLNFLHKWIYTGSILLLAKYAHGSYGDLDLFNIELDRPSEFYIFFTLLQYTITARTILNRGENSLVTTSSYLYLYIR